MNLNKLMFEISYTLIYQFNTDNSINWRLSKRHLFRTDYSTNNDLKFTQNYYTIKSRSNTTWKNFIMNHKILQKIQKF